KGCAVWRRGSLAPEHRTEDSGGMSGLLFGIFPGSVNASGRGLTAGLPDDPGLIERALADLCPEGPFLVRAYVHYPGEGRIGTVAPEGFRQYIHSGRRLDLVLCYRPDVENLANWTAFVRQMVYEHGAVLHSLQIAEEPNNADPGTGGDGASPGVRDAVIAGV